MSAFPPNVAAAAGAPRSLEIVRRRPVHKAVALQELVQLGGACAIAAATSGPQLAVVAGCWAATQYFSIDSDRRSLGVLSVRAVLARLVWFASVVVALGLFADPAAAYTSVAAAFAVAGASCLGRLALRSPSYRRVLRVEECASVLVVAPGAAAADLAARRLRRPGVEVVGIAIIPGDAGDGDDRLTGESRTELAGKLVAEARRVGADTVVLHPLSTGVLDLESLAWALEEFHLRLAMATSLPVMAGHRISPVSLGGTTTVNLMPSRPSASARWVRGVVERGIAAVMLLVTLPVLLLIAMVVKFDSAGPALFRQIRVREGGREFTMLKFRTMLQDAEDRVGELKNRNLHGGGVLFKMRKDPRITRVGRILRSTSLDELPQLVNVIKGEMSLIGPRPALPREVARYDHRARRRLAVRPGLTGLWQVSGRSELSWEQSVQIDVDYVDNWSFGRDLKIAAKTVRVVLSRSGAY